MSIRSKFLVFTAFLLVTISIYVYIHYPKEYKKNVISTLQTQVSSMAEMIALGVGIGSELNNFQVIIDALNWAKQDESLIYILVLDVTGEEYATLNPTNYKVDAKNLMTTKGVTEHRDHLRVVIPVIYNKQNYGNLVVGYSLKNLTQNIAQNRNTTFLVSTTILLIGLGLSIIFSNKITSPLLQLTKAANAISLGRSDVKIEVIANDEAGELAKAFKVMMEKINTSFEEIKTINLEMEATRDQALEANRAKSEFLSRMSHELRTPMNAILGFAQLLDFNQKEPLTESQKGSVGEILKAGKHLLELINEVLDLAKVESGNLSLSMEPVALKEVLEEAVALVFPLAQNRGINIQHLLAPNHEIVVLADRTRLKQILINLLSNAIKYNKENGLCTIHSEKTSNSKILIKVSDTGAGISKENIDDL